MRLREVVSGRSAFTWRRRCARSTSWLRELSVASARLADRRLPDLARWSTPTLGTCLTELTNAIFHAAPAGEPAPAARRPVTASANRQASSRDKIRPGRAVAAGQVASVRSAGPGPGRRVPAMPPRRASATSPPLAAAPAPLSRSRLAALARDIPQPWHGSDPSIRRHAAARHSVPMPSAAAAKGSRDRPGSVMSAGPGGTKMPDPAAASTALGHRVNARAGAALPDALGLVPPPRRPPLGAAAGWARPIAGPPLGLALIDVSGQPPATAPEAGLRTTPAPGPSPSAATRPAGPPIPPDAPLQTEPSAAQARLSAATEHERRIARSSLVRETDATAAPEPVIDPPATAAHFAALTALDRRHGYLPPVAAPLSMAESRAEERHRFDPLEFAEHVRAALIDDARRHGIGV